MDPLPVWHALPGRTCGASRSAIVIILPDCHATLVIPYSADTTAPTPPPCWTYKMPCSCCRHGFTFFTATAASRLSPWTLHEQRASKF